MGFLDRLSGKNKDQGSSRKPDRELVCLRRSFDLEMNRLAEQATQFFGSMPAGLISAEGHLDQAENYLAEGAFVPFWESIEAAAKMLGRVYESIGNLRAQASHYANMARLHENPDALKQWADQITHDVLQVQSGSPDHSPFCIELKRLYDAADARNRQYLMRPLRNPVLESFRVLALWRLHSGEDRDTPFPFSITPQHTTKLADACKATTSRMDDLVHAAHRNIDFATIYEQRRTNHILIAGFANLADALGQMTSRITRSLDELNISIGAMRSTLSQSLDTIHTDLRDGLEMLDNIQRGRRP